ncbi:MAG: hypothetical protein Q4E88_02760 [Coriobacteriia bacterium]|nr:hypothetical protein [Coriobacteriia bacterium]
MELETIKFKPNPQGIKQILGSSEMLNACGNAADKICNRANSMATDVHGQGDPYKSARDINQKGFAHGAVYTNSLYGVRDNAKNNTLLKAMGGGA